MRAFVVWIALCGVMDHFVDYWLTVAFAGASRDNLRIQFLHLIVFLILTVADISLLVPVFVIDFILLRFHRSIVFVLGF